jgi:putative FmdB family regulatory protein
MPIFDFVCNGCAHEFEALVRGASAPVCPKCGSEDLERKLSFPVPRSDTTRDLVKRETRRRDAAQAKDQAHEQRKYELNHD